LNSPLKQQNQKHQTKPRGCSPRQTGQKRAHVDRALRKWLAAMFRRRTSGQVLGRSNLAVAKRVFRLQNKSMSTIQDTLGVTGFGQRYVREKCSRYLHHLLRVKLLRLLP